MAYNAITNATQNLIAYHTLKTTFDPMGKRAARKFEEYRDEVYGRLGKREKISDGSDLIAQRRFKDGEAKARTMTEAIDEYLKRHPDAEEELRGLIDESRKTKRRYLDFGVVGDAVLDDAVYMDALKQIGIPQDQLGTTFNTVMDISDLLAEKKKDGLVSVLVK